MRIQEHYDNFMRQPEIEEYVEIYCLVLENKADNWQKLYYGLMNEVSKDRGPFVVQDEQLKAYGQIRDLIDNENDDYSKKCLITALFDALMAEKIKTYSLKFDAPLIFKEKLHKIYLKEKICEE